MTAYIELRVSKDGGYTWSDWKGRDIGATGDFIRPLIWRRLGNSRHFTFDFRATGAPDILAGSILDANGDWIEAPVVGGAYADENRPWTFQDTCNYIPVAAEKQGVRSMAKLRGAPGERLFAIVGNGPIRGARDVEGKLFVVSGTGLYRVFPDTTSTLLGTIPGSGRCTLTHNQEGGGSKLVVSNGTIRGWTYDTITETFAQIDDKAFPGFLTVDYLDQYILGIEPQRRFAFHSDLANAGEYSTLDRFESESSPDRLLAQAVNAGQWWLFGERTIDVYANTGAATGTFQRIPGSTIDRGICGTHALAKLDNTLFFWGDDGTFYRLNGYTPVRVSTHPIEQAARVCDLSGVFCTVYEDAGHKIVWSTFPDGRTWGYDVASGEWFRRQSFNRQNWRMSTLVKWRGVWLAGDSENGRLYQIDWALRDEAGSALIGRRTTGALHNNENRLTVNAVRVLVDSGRTATLPTGPGDIIDPLVIFNPLPEAYVGVAVSHSYQATGGVRPYVFDIAAGSLPAGLSMSSAGVVTGTPTTQAAYAWRVRVTDAQGFTATLDQGQSASPLIEGPTVYNIGIRPPVLVTNVESFTGSETALVAGPSMGFAATVNIVSAAPGGLYAAGAESGSALVKLQLRKYDPVAVGWDSIADPADMPVEGPLGFGWSHDSQYLAAGISTGSPNNLVIYRRNGDTFTALDLSSHPPDNCGFITFDSVSQRLAVDNGSSAAGVYVYDFVGEDLTGGKTVNFGDVGTRIAFLPGVGSRYLAVGTIQGIYVIACTETPMRVAAQLLATSNVRNQAGAGIHWDASGSYLIGVSSATAAEIVNVFNFDGSVIGSETLTFVSTAASAPAGDIRDSSLTDDGRYLIVAPGTGTRYVYDLGTAQPPVLTRIADLPASAGEPIAVSWTNFEP